MVDVSKETRKIKIRELFSGKTRWSHVEFTQYERSNTEYSTICFVQTRNVAYWIYKISHIYLKIKVAKKNIRIYEPYGFIQRKILWLFTRHPTLLGFLTVRC
jgi:hypothetical protein